MPLTVAERSKRYREKIKSDPEKYDKHKKKELKRLQKIKKPVKDMSEEEKTVQRKRWREQKRKQKEKKEEKEKNSLPQHQKEPAELNRTDRLLKVSLAYKTKYHNICRNYKNAMKKVQKYKKSAESYRKKMYRLNKDMSTRIEILQTENNKLKASNEVMEISLRSAYKNSNAEQKRSIKQTVLNIRRPIVRNQRSELLGLKGKLRIMNNIKKVNLKLKADIEQFYLRDDVTRSTAGKKETRTKNKEKVQIRYMVDTLKNLYDVYKQEGGKLSFSSFYRYKPYYVLCPCAQNRQTCLCVKHSNFEFMFRALKNKGIIAYQNVKCLINEISCDVTSFKCMYNKCENCRLKRISHNQDLDGDIMWYKWGSVPHSYVKAGSVHNTKKTAKITMKTSKQALLTIFEKSLADYKIHVFNSNEQQRQYRYCIKNLKDDEIAILCDFSENYAGKYAQEIQSTHYGASTPSITLHCGAVYWKDRAQSFVSLSDDNRHDPAAIWAHLLPVIKYARSMVPQVKVIHFFSDGPCTQYRQKKNFYFLSLFVRLMNLSHATWNFSEAGHGKSVADAIGGCVKRQMDKRVAYGNDIINADDAFKQLGDHMNSVKLFLIPESDINNISSICPENLQAVKGTMKLHQISTSCKNIIYHRLLSCFCGESDRGLCSCQSPTKHVLQISCPESEKQSTEQPNNEPNLAKHESDQENEEAKKSPSNETEDELIEQLHETYADIINLSDVDDGKDISVFSESANIDEDFMILLVDDFSKSTFETPGCSNTVVQYNQEDFNENSSTNKTLEKKHIIPFPVDFKSPLKKTTKSKTVSDIVQTMPKKIRYDVKPKKPIIPNKISSSFKKFPCNLCKTHQPFDLNKMVKCMVCTKWVCFKCSATTFFDYICTICLEEK